jgi:hypothetical protein
MSKRENLCVVVSRNAIAAPCVSCDVPEGCNDTHGVTDMLFPNKRDQDSNGRVDVLNLADDLTN